MAFVFPRHFYRNFDLFRGQEYATICKNILEQSMKKRFDLITLCKELPFCVCIFCLAHIGENGEPFGLALLLGLRAAGYPVLLSFITFVVSAFSVATRSLTWVYLCEALLLIFSFFLREKLFGRNVSGKLLLPFSAFIAGLIVYTSLIDFLPYAIPMGVQVLEDAFFQKAVLCIFITLFGAVCISAAKALKERLLRCKMRMIETVFLLFSFIVCGIGFCRFFGVNAYMGMAFYLLLLFCIITKENSGAVCAFVLAVPCFLLNNAHIGAFFLYGTVVTLFAKTGKTGAAFALLSAYLAVGYFSGVHLLHTKAFVGWLLCALLPIVAFFLTPDRLLRHAEQTLIFYKERHLPRIAINRNRESIAERLFEVSALFKQIQHSFLSLGNTDGDTSAKNYMQNRVLSSVCKNCSGYGTCLNAGLLPCLAKMLDVGCIKGKVSIVDLPTTLANLCGRQSDFLYALNNQLGEYRAYMQDAEVAACGRQLLANQALGVSEIAKTLALEQSEPLTIYSKKERAIENALLGVGIVCSEIMVYGSESPTISLVMQGNGNVKRLASAVSKTLGQPFCLSEKLTLAKEKYCCILRSKPAFDAAFGIASRIKHGERFSGDTHTVIRIDERRFLVALSDGMGSGEYAKQVSENTISLIESFYRAKMPPELTLSTINRLLSFAKEETFACVDIAVVDLEQGRADVVKIGAPTGFILSENSLQILESDSFPLGILECIHPKTSSYSFKPEDTLVFLSDGITEAFHSTIELFEAIQAIPNSNPQNFADELMKIAIERYGGIAKDDMTVLAVRIFPSVN